MAEVKFCGDCAHRLWRDRSSEGSCGKHPGRSLPAGRRLCEGREWEAARLGVRTYENTRTKPRRRDFAEGSAEFSAMEGAIQRMFDLAPGLKGLTEAETVQLAIDVLERRRA